MQPTNFLQSALWYAQHDFRIFPCHPGGKHPLTGHGFKDATCAEQQIRDWWSDTPTANIGLPTGAVTGLLTLDVDPRNGGHEALAELIKTHGPLPETARQRTGGGGQHFVFRHPGYEVPCATNAFGRGLDLKGDGGYIIAAPSFTSALYEWREPDALLRLAEPPDWILRPRRHVVERATPLQTFDHGNRNSGLTQLAGRWRAAGMAEGELSAALHRANEARCKPPLDRREVDQILNSAARWSSGPPLPKIQDVENAADLCRREFDPMIWRVENLIPAEGVSMLVARPKFGKSFFALQASVAVANGKPLMGRFSSVPPARVLYFALEDNPRRMKNRLELVYSDREALLNIDILYDLKLDHDGITLLDQRLSDSDYGLVVIDTFLNACQMRKAGADPVRADYKEIGVLRDLARTHKAAILLVHHNRKANKGDDPTSLDQILGTTGTSAAVDSILILNNDREGNRFLVSTGKDSTLTEPQMIQFAPDGGGWIRRGNASAIPKGKESQDLTEYLQAGPKTIKEIASNLQKSYDSVRMQLNRLTKQGFVIRDGETFRVADTLF